MFNHTLYYCYSIKSFISKIHIQRAKQRERFEPMNESQLIITIFAAQSTKQRSASHMEHRSSIIINVELKKIFPHTFSH